MYLSELEVVGFKSFAQKTQLKFNAGMTAIVGPNGCGKTNVVDALRWALGEQKASTLRSDKMYDVIFNGTKNRRALGLAEVSLVIENNRNILPTEYSQVRITRRLFRSGESQYLLNGVECRLRDINDLFMDTGMGPDAYSVIELKMIETMLSNKADERRRLFEEAAGVTKYKSRRREAERKLEAIQGDLTRIQDIVTEVQKNVRGLSRQAAKAKLASEIKHKFDRVEKMILLLEYAALREQISPLALTLEQQRALKGEREEDVQENEHVLGELERAVNEVQSRLEEADSRAAEAALRVSNASRDLAVARERKASLERAQERLLKESGELSSNLDNVNTRLAEAQIQRETVAAELASHEGVYARAKAESDAANAAVHEARQRVRSSSEAVMGLMNRINAVRAEAERTIASINALRRRIDDSERSLAQQSEKQSHIQRDHASAQSRMVEFDHAINTAQDELASAQELQSTLQATLDHDKQELATLQAEFSRKSASLEFLQGLVSSADSAQFLLETPTWQPRERLTLAEAVATEDRFRVALEAALGETANYFVVETAQEAASGIQALKDGDKGKATFVCMERVPSVDTPPELPAREGLVGWASELIHAARGLQGDDAHKEFIQDHLRFALRGLLGRTLIVQSMEAAQQAVSDGLADAAVTLEGELVAKRGLVRGGGSKPSEGAMIGKREQIATLQRETSALQTSIYQLREQIEETTYKVREINLKRLSDALRQAETAKNKHEQAVAQLEFQMNAAEESIEARRREIATFTAEIRAIEESAAAHGNADGNAEGKTGLAQIPTLEAEKQEAERVVAEAQAALHQAEEEFAHSSDAAREAELEVVHARNEERSLSAELNRLEREAESLEERITARTHEAEEAAEEAEEVTARFDELSGLFDSIQHDANAAQEQRNGIAQELTEARKRIQTHNEETRSVRREYESLTANVHETELALANLHNRADGFRTRAQDEFAFDIDAIDIHHLPEEFLVSPVIELSVSHEEKNVAATTSQEAVFKPETDPRTLFAAALAGENTLPALKNESKSLKQQLQSIGTVNPLAYEEYQRESERLEFLEAQFKDLQESENTLKHTIQEINQTAQKQFYDVFERIRTNFISIFTSLFNEGDEADLQIEEGDPLEAPIKIIAKPRGKRPASIEMLSGGEKTLTAIALLFAIYLVKPSPFCILDEVDAPLDDANIDRYIRLIRRFSETTQFIMITHNKRTMEAADTLYGVTMEEEGVSKIVSVKFSQYEDGAAMKNGETLKNGASKVAALN
jgi:chromosome segregation protein